MPSSWLSSSALCCCGIVLTVGFIGTVHSAMEINAVAYNMMGSPPNLTGPLEQNFLLTEAERYKIGQLKGPESFVYHNGHIYTGLSDGRIVDISDCGVRTVAVICTPRCSRPLGIRMGPDGKLVVADSLQGILTVNIQTGLVEKLFSIETPINGRRCRFINDLVVARDGTILFTDSSAKWTRNEYLYIILEGESSGRLIALGPTTKKAIVVLDKLSFPNGLEFGPDEQYLLIAETSRARIRKLDLRKSRLTWLRQTWFATNLPGLPDNIRSSGRGTYWVAMASSRNDNMTSSRVDQYATTPEMRNMVAMMATMDQINEMSEKYGTILEVDAAGDYVRSLQDPTGERVPAVSEILEADGFLYLGSFDKPYVSRIPEQPTFNVDRFIAKIKSTCRGQKLNLGNLRKVLRRIVAIAQFRKALLEARRRQDALSTTAMPVTGNATESLTSNTTDTTPEMNSTVTDSPNNSSTPQETTTMSVDEMAQTTPSGSTTPSDPEAGDSDTASTTQTTSSAISVSPGISQATVSTGGSSGVTMTTPVTSSASAVSSQALTVSSTAPTATSMATSTASTSQTTIP